MQSPALLKRLRNSPILREKHTQCRQPHPHEHRTTKSSGSQKSVQPKKGSDIAWMDLMTHRIRIISESTHHTCERNSWLLMKALWWDMSCSDLVVEHDKVVQKHFRLMQMSKLWRIRSQFLLQQHRLRIRHLHWDIPTLIQHQESALNGADFLRRTSSIDAQLQAPGNTIVVRPPDNQIVVWPLPTSDLTVASPHIAAPTNKDNEDQSDAKDALLATCVPSELGTPCTQPPEFEQEDPTINVRCIEHIGNFHRGDPMEDLDFPDKLLPRDASHFSGCHVEMWD
jgi:hypothetical protein